MLQACNNEMKGRFDLASCSILFACYEGDRGSLRSHHYASLVIDVHHKSFKTAERLLQSPKEMVQ